MHFSYGFLCYEGRITLYDNRNIMHDLPSLVSSLCFFIYLLLCLGWGGGGG